jgi:hypothetical protein
MPHHRANRRSAAGVLHRALTESRQKRKDLHDRRNALAKTMEALAANLRGGQQAMRNLLASVESNTELAKHAEGWSWKEADSSISIPETQQGD